MTLKVPAEPKKPLLRKVPSRTPDYNPDKERHVDHTFVVQNATKTPKTEITLGETTIPLNKEGRAFIKDEALAREIQQEHRFDATVTRMRTPTVADKGHRYHFGQWPEMPWKRGKHEEGEEPRQSEDTQAAQGRDAAEASGSSGVEHSG